MKVRKPILQKIVAIGGGSIGWGGKKPEVTPISREIIRLSGKKNPRLLFLPTASSDDVAYARMVQNHFGRKLGCRVETLYLLREKPVFSIISQKIRETDIIYVGGGNTLMMMNLWKKRKVDKLLREAHRRGKVLCGTSAGALCWFRQGNSDSWKYYNPKAALIKVTGLGFLKALGCPHYDGEKDRKPQLKSMMLKTPGVAIALDNCAALEIRGDRCRVFSAKPSAAVYRVFWKGKRYCHERLNGRMGWMPLTLLLKKT
jgi:dipeptidase E